MIRTRTLALLVAIILVGSAPSAFADEGDAPELNPTATMKIGLIADFAAGGDTAVAEAFAPTVTELRTSGIGWGALFKIYKLAAAMGVDASTLAAEIGADGEFDFGELKNALTEEQRAVFDELPKNFGTLKAAEKKAEKAEAKAERKAEKKAERDARKAERDAAKAERGADDDDDDSSEEADG